MRLYLSRMGTGRITPGRFFAVVALAAAILLAAAAAWSQETLQAVTDNVSYNAGSEVRVRIFLPASQHPRSAPFDIFASLRYAGEQERLEVKDVLLAAGLNPAGKELAADYHTLWKIPEDARTGRYEVDAVLADSQSHQTLLVARRVTSFAVYRKLVQIERIELEPYFLHTGRRRGLQGRVAEPHGPRPREPARRVFRPLLALDRPDFGAGWRGRRDPRRERPDPCRRLLGTLVRSGCRGQAG